MFSAIFKYEFWAWLKSPITYLFCLVFFGLALIMMLGTGGLFDEPSTATSNVRLLNSTYEINFIFHYFNKFLLLLVPVIVGSTLYKDYKSETYTISYSFPIKKQDYLFGKFLSSFSITVLISFVVGFALLLGASIIGTENPKIGPFQFYNYCYSYGFFVIPNLFIFSLFIFIIVGISRNINAGFIAVLMVFLFQTIIENLFTGSPYFIALLDPLGQNATMYETRNWTLENKNLKALPTSGIILYNRLFWIAVSALCFGLFYHKFKLQHESPFKAWLPGFLKTEKAETSIHNKGKVKQISAVIYDTSFYAQLRATLSLAIVDFKFIAKNWMFYLFSFFGLLAVFFMLLKVTNTGRFNLLPLTRLMLQIPLIFYSMVILLSTFLYSGMLVHRAKIRRMNLLIDATTIPNWSLLLSKLMAIVFMQIFLLLILLLGGILIQSYNGYYNFEFGQYLFHLFLITLPTMFIWAIFSMFVYTISPNFFLGLFLLILTWLGIFGFEQIGVNTNLVKFNTYPNINYSDFNGYAEQLPAIFLLKSYWFAFSFFLLTITYLLWKRGVASSIFGQLKKIKTRVTKTSAACLGLSACLFLGLGMKIYKEESKDRSIKYFEASKSEILKNFKKDFAPFSSLTPPIIDDIKLDLNIFPEEQKFTAKGRYKLINKSEQVIDSLLVKTGFDELTEVTSSINSTLILRDSMLQYSLYKLQEAMQPNDTIYFDFSIRNKSNTTFERHSSVIKNGTYIKQDILPRFGYIYDNKSKEPTDSLAAKNNYFYKDAEMCKIETVISTSVDQTAIAPGDLISKRAENQRNIFHYKTNERVKINFSFHSGIFTKMIEIFKGKTFEIYYHDMHESNVQRMQKGLKAALNYNSKWFNDYPYETIRVVEYPHTEENYAATLMANNIPTSEIQFIVNSEAMKDKFDLPFYVMAHELTHEWFGNKTMPANALGSRMLTESITEYISLNIYERNYGKKKALKFLEQQHKRYKRGHLKNEKTEHSLSRVKPEQQYISYGKGSIAFNVLAHYLGDTEVNRILKMYLDRFQNRHDNYPTSADLIRMLKEEIPEDFHYLIKDYFESIILYNAELKEVKKLTSENGINRVEVNFVVKKFESLSEAPQDLNDFVEIGFYNVAKELVQVEQIRISETKNKIVFDLKETIVQVELDPNLLLIEMDRENNFLAL